MHLPPQDALLSMGDAGGGGGGGGFSLAGPLLRSPVSGGPPSRLHSIEAILGFTKEDPRLGSFQGQEATAGQTGERGGREGGRRRGRLLPNARPGGAEARAGEPQDGTLRSVVMVNHRSKR
ncbi:hypothetical protein E2320_017757 [Naja naja]|nr:hypothetical protein E2320_017757 [Naja naja]